MEHRAYLSIGANLGDRLVTCERAVDMLDENSRVRVTARSCAYETDPVGYLDQPSFVNMSVEIKTSLEPLDLLYLIKDTEKKIGRKPGLRWGPRVIDLDIVLYEDKVLDTPLLHIPHKRMHERSFVLVPLCEIAPDALHPRLEKTVEQLLFGIDGNCGGVRKLDYTVNNT